MVTALQQKTQALFNGYPNSSRTAVQEFLDYVFGIPTTDPTFATLTVTGASTLHATSVIGALGVTGNISATGSLSITGTSTLHGDATLDSDLSVAGNLQVDTNAVVAGDLEALANFTVALATDLQGTVSSNLKISAGTTVASGVILQLGADVDMNLSIGNVTGGKEVFLLNQNVGGTVAIMGGSGSGTGQTIVGTAADKIGFFNGSCAVRQTLPAAAPADAAAMIAEWQDYKAKIALYNFFALT